MDGSGRSGVVGVCKAGCEQGGGAPYLIDTRSGKELPGSAVLLR